MFTAYGFHIDFQFRGQKSLPRDLWMAQTPKCTFSEPVSSRMQFLDFFFFSTIFYVYWHMLGIVELKKLQVGAFGDSLLPMLLPRLTVLCHRRARVDGPSLTENFHRWKLPVLGPLRSGTHLVQGTLRS